MQEACAASFNKLKYNHVEHDAILFMDATDAQRKPVLAGGWVKRGHCFPVKRDSGRRWRNGNGVVDVETMAAVIRDDDTIDAESTAALFQQTEPASPEGTTNTVFCDGARDDRSKPR